MKIIRVGPYTVLARVEWVASQAETQKEAIAETLAQDSTKKYGIVIEGLETFAIGLTEKPEKATVGAAWLAESQKTDGDFILIEKLASDEYWMCAIKNGTPFYGSDLIGSSSSIKQEAELLLKSGGFRLITADEKMGEALSSFATHYTATNFEGSVKGKGNFKVKNLKSGKVIALTAVALAVLCIGGYLFWDNYSAGIQKKQAIAKSMATKAMKAQQEKKVEEDMKAAFEVTKNKMIQEKLDFVQSALSAQGGADASAKWTKVMTDLKIDTAGWQYTEASCNNVDCALLLAPEPGATNKDLFKMFPGVSLDQKWNGEIKVPVKWEKSQTVVSNLRSKAEFEVNGISDFQRIKGSGFTVVWTPLLPITVSVPYPKIEAPATVNGKPAQPGSIQQQKVKKDEIVPIGVAKGTFKVEGKHVWSAEGVSRQLASPEVVFEKMVVLFDKSSNGAMKSWTLEGSYYAKP